MPDPTGLSAAPLFDLDFALRRHGDMEIVRMLLPLCVRSLQQALGLLDNTVTAPLARADALHKLRGGAMELGLERLVQAAQAYETACRTDGHDPQIADAHDLFMPVLKDTLAALQASQLSPGQRTS